ncbi:MAG: ankyrin repeat domain-containing protein, partial [Myxococcaceae bacterium]
QQEAANIRQELETAIRGNNLQQVEKLAPQVDLNQFELDGKPVLIWAVEQKKPELVEVLLKHSANPDDALGVAFDLKQNNIIKQLVNAGARLDQKNFSGKEPLAWALDDGKRGFLFEYATKHPQKVKIHDQSFLAWAMANNEIDLAQKLVENGANLEEKNEHGDTVLCEAVTLDKQTLFEALLKKGANLSVACYEGKTALHLAYELHRNYFIRELKSHHADEQLRDNQHKIPEDYKDFWLSWNYSKQSTSTYACQELFKREGSTSLKKAYRNIKRHLHPDQCSIVNTAEDCRKRDAVIESCRTTLNL